MHTRAQIMQERFAHIRRKKSILKYVYGEDSKPWGGDGALSKNKIHCSCHMCANKTNTRSLRGHSVSGRKIVHETKNWKFSDLRKLTKGL